jgi:hypothetical protein
MGSTSQDVQEKSKRNIPDKGIGRYNLFCCFICLSVYCFSTWLQFVDDIFFEVSFWIAIKK